MSALPHKVPPHILQGASDRLRCTLEAAALTRGDRLKHCQGLTRKMRQEVVEEIEYPQLDVTRDWDGCYGSMSKLWTLHRRV